PAGASEPLVTAVVWTRGELADAWLPFLQRQRKGLTRAALDKDLEVADPIITAATPGGTTVPAQALWVALAHSSGEDELGLGTVVRFAPAAKQAQVFHPPLLANCDITHLLSFDNDTFLLGTRLAYNRAVYPCVGLASLQARTGQTESISLPGPWPSPPMVTALGSSDRVWVATDSAICGGAPGGWLCWRIVPAVTLTSAMTVYNKPGEKAGAELKPGEYEVLWANQGFLEIATKDSYDAWLAADDYAEAAARNFDVEPWKLLNTATGISPIRPLTKPGGDALEGTLAFRARLEKLETPPGTPPGWVKVRIHAGWIERGALQVTPGMVPLPNK
ncbi:MAG TPA: hypothetical protein VEH49_05905, partial [Methylomirabilota bacterium]|nr:hypothetical protein [Methylomirabilota bacterium]